MPGPFLGPLTTVMKMKELFSLKAVTSPGDATDFFDLDLPPFDPAATSAYSRGNALWLIESCRLSYREDAASRKDYYDKKAHLEERPFSVNRTQGAVLVGSSHAILAFRGSLGFDDWLSDFDALPVQWAGVQVHQGFKKQLDDVWKGITAELDALTVPVFFTGHSLGAALATLAAARRFKERPDKAPAALYTFGSPRVGVGSFKEIFPRGFLHCRIVDDLDIVPTVPPGRFLGLFGAGYHHVGVPFHIEHDRRLTRGNLGDDTEGGPFSRLFKGLGYLRKMFDRANQQAADQAPPEIADHAPINYTVRLDKAGDPV